MKDLAMAAFAVTTFVLALIVSGPQDLREHERATTHYCAQVQLFEETNRREGHPPYRGLEECEAPK